MKEQFVLIADQDNDTLAAAAKILQEDGMLPVLAVDGKQAYKALKADVHFLAAFISLDVALIGALDLLHFIKESGRLASIPVIILSGPAIDQRTGLAMKAGAIASMRKPINAEQFRTLLATLSRRTHDEKCST